MSASDSDSTLALDGELTVDTARARYLEWLPRLAGVDRFDLGGLSAADSAGVAVVQALRLAAEQRNGKRPRLHAVPDRFRQLCVAHRIDVDGH